MKIVARCHHEASMSDLRNRAGGDTIYCLHLQDSCTVYVQDGNREVVKILDKVPSLS